ncbi:serine hydrolase domain-containing protein [Anaerobacillus alkalidiazotrophicus]|uniref:serine hydrolase domain-containing protein n=1 Tax=Anaerobacillus alkalidiazotrophicus TaxID=472963 RepID=UPI000A5FA581|nr:serine hydrolase [Anaerobacillus alkalidiazotrophicus]
MKTLVVIGIVVFGAIIPISIFKGLNSNDSVPTSNVKNDESTWEYHYSLEAAGWSSEKLMKARTYFDSLNSTAAIAIVDGKVLFEWGDVSKNTNVHSIRKSFLSALFGIHHENGIDLHATLKELDIKEIQPLSDLEKEAQVVDLLTSRSGVFLKSGQESWNMRRKRPIRGRFAPGSFFYYNNWDFNVLGTIFNKQTGTDLFEEFFKKLALPLGMEDFSLEQTKYKYEFKKSLHPSYLFQMSARDMARFGQLYLQNGNWKGQQIIPENWVIESTAIQAHVPGNNVYDYGYMWWVAEPSQFEGGKLISAVGRYGQSIDIIPSLNLVFVHRLDSNQKSWLSLPQKVSQEERLQLLKLVIDAKAP